MKRKFLIFICLILFIVSIAGVSATENANQTISDDTLSVSENIDVISAKDDGTFTALQEKIENAPVNSTIYLENDYKYDDGFTTNGIFIDRDLTINGNGHTIDGDKNSRIFNIKDCNVTLYNIEFINGYSLDENGGVIFAIGESDVLSETGTGKLIINNCNFVDNSAYSDDYYLYGGAICSSLTTQLNDCNFTDNWGDYGGAVCLWGENSAVKNCNFENNSAYRGALAVRGANSIVDKCSFTNNLAYLDGGALFWVEKNGILRNSIFKDNEARGSYDGYYGRGGAIIWSGFLANNGLISNCEFSDNIALSGGAIFLEDDYYSDFEEYSTFTMHIENSKFVSNHANDGGAIYSQRLLDIKDSEFDKNNATDMGGAIYTSNGIFKGTVTAHDPWGRPSITYDVLAFFPLYVSGNTLFKDNVANNGGAIMVEYSIDNDLCGNLNITDGVVFDGNVAENGGAILMETTNSYIGSATFKNNIATEFGGAIYSQGDSYAIIEKSKFNDNKFTSNVGRGSSICAEKDLQVYDSQFSSNLNKEFIYYKDYEFHKDGILVRNKGNLTLNNNKMTADNDYDIFYAATSPMLFKTYLVFENKSIRPNENVNLGELRDDNGNSIRVDEITVTLTNVDNSKITDTAILKFDNKTGGYNYKCTLENGVYKVTGSVSSNIASDCKVVIGYLTISDYNINVPDVTKNYRGPEKLEITLTEGDKPIANAKVEININEVFYQRTTDSNGKAYMNINLQAGTYNAIVTYQDASTTAKITVNPLTTTTTISYKKNSQNNFTLTALVDPSTATGDVVFTVNGKDYAADKVVGGKATRTLSNLTAGNYEAKASYKCDVNHKASASSSVKFTVEEVKYDVSAPDLTKYYHGPERFVVTVKENNMPVVDKKVTIYLNGVPYNRTTNSNGQASMGITLNSGKYPVTTEFEGIKVDSTITVKSTVSGKDVTKIYKNGTQYYATFVDTSGNLLKNTDVKFNINGVFYTRKTNDQGVAKMNINLNPGDYIITALNPNSGEQYTNLVKVLPSIAEVHDLTKYYKNDSKLTFRLLNDQGRPAGAGVSAKININGVFYERKTNASGYINMNINLNPGTYVATLEYNGLMASSTVKVLPRLSAQDLVMGYKDGSKFKAKLLDGKGKPQANQEITFNINGVLYKRTTGSDGIASLTINLERGEYIITSMSSDGEAISNKITIQDQSPKLDTTLGLGQYDSRGVWKTYEKHYASSGLSDGLIIYPRLVDSKGNVLDETITVECYGAGYSKPFKTSSHISTSSIFLGNDFDHDFIPSGGKGYVYLIFEGNSKYNPSKYRINFN